MRTFGLFRDFGDAFLKTLQAELRVAKLVSGFMPPVSPLRRRCHQVALQLGYARTHLPSFVLPQCLDPTTPAHLLYCKQPFDKCCVHYAKHTLIYRKRESSNFINC